MALIQINPGKDKQKGGKGGLIGSIAGGVLGAGLGIAAAPATGGASLAAAGLAGFGGGSGVGGLVGNAIDPRKLDQAAAPLQTAASQPQAQLARVQEAERTLASNPTLLDPESSARIHDVFARFKERFA